MMKLVDSPAASLAKGSQEKTLRIESPPYGKHPWTTWTPEPRPIAFTRPAYVSVRFILTLLRRRFEAAYFSRGLGHSQRAVSVG
jgi:hypothetical protein